MGIPPNASIVFAGASGYHKKDREKHLKRLSLLMKPDPKQGSVGSS